MFRNNADPADENRAQITAAFVDDLAVQYQTSKGSFSSLTAPYQRDGLDARPAIVSRRLPLPNPCRSASSERSLKNSYGTVDLGATMALILLSIIPVIVFYLTSQKYIIKGVAAGAVKG